MVVAPPEPEEVAPPGLLVIVHGPPAGSPVNGTLPKAFVQVGCKAGPTTGAVGVIGCALITMFSDTGDVQSEAFVTMKLYVPGGSPGIVVPAPVPERVILPGFPVSVHVPVGGKPFNTILPVSTVQVGWVTGPAIGAAGVDGCSFICTSPEAGEAHPWEFVTVKVYDPETSSGTVVLVPVPVETALPGILVSVQVPVAGKPFNMTLPVATVQVGSTIVPATGAAGVVGFKLITTLPDGTDVHPEALVTLKV
jgi:hypothetical protein